MKMIRPALLVLLTSSLAGLGVPASFGQAKAAHKAAAKKKPSSSSPTALMKVTGNGGTYTGSLGQQIAGSNIGSQYVSADLKMAGNGNVIVNYQGPPKTPVRILTLVE